MKVPPELFAYREFFSSDYIGMQVLRYTKI